jgi:acyl-CoA synthetase (AMP-forming)/AMP-acid ligase II
MSRIYKSKYQDIQIPNITYTQFIYENFGANGDRVAIVDSASNFTLTFKQIQQYTFVLAKNLQSEFDFKKGHVFAILLPNVPLYCVIFHGVSSTGGASTTINPLYTPEEVHKQLVDSEARLLVTIPLFLENAIQAVKGTKVEKIFVMSPDKVNETGNVVDLKRLLGLPKDMKPLNVKIDVKEDVVVIPYSSGTTGMSKGVLLTHYNLVANMLQCDVFEKLTSDEVTIGFLPYFHIYGMLLMNYSLWKCVKSINVAKFEFVDLLRIIQEHQITRVALVPPIILAFAKEPIVDKFNLKSVKVITSGAAPLGPQLTELAAKKLNCVVKQGFGMTELSPTVCASPSDAVKPGSCGILVPNVELKVVSIQDGKTLLPPNQEGELVFRGPNVMKGYLKNKKATDETVIDGWLHTGDTGYIDEDGYIYVVDRLKELIKYKGFQVPPAELEALLLKHEGIADCAVIGVPDEEAGEIPKAFIVKKKGSEKLTEDEIMQYVAKHVNPRKRVRQVEFIDVIPKSATGKILRRMLRSRPVSKL